MQRDLPLILGVLAALFVLSIASEQCYVGQKLFSMEANRAVCAPLVPYPCVAKCEWVANCSASQSWKAFKGRRSYISGLLINSRSLLVLCCTSLATIVKSRKQCSWRPYESLPVIGPSIRLDPVLGQHSYIREAVMTRESEGRVGIRIEVCKFKRERQNCKIENMSETEKKRFEKVRNRWARAIGADPDVLFGKKKEEKVEKDAKAGGDEKAKEIDAKKAEEKKLDKFAEDAFTTDQPEIIEEKTEGAAEVQPFPAEKGVTAEFGATTDAPEFGSSTSSDDLVTATAESGSGDLITATVSDDGVTSLVDLFASTASPDFESTSGTPEEGSAFRIIDDPINESGSGAPATEAPEEFSGAFQSTETPVEGSGATAATETEFGASTIEPLSETATAIIEETTNVNEEAATTGAAADFEVATTAAGDSFAAESTTPAFDEDANDFPLISAA